MIKVSPGATQPFPLAVDFHFSPGEETGVVMPQSLM
jgi:hypothetical protein